MLGDIIHDNTGYFFRDNANGTYDDLSSGNGPRTVGPASMVTPTVVLVRDGKPTGHGDPLAARVAVVLARRYA